MIINDPISILDQNLVSRFVSKNHLLERFKLCIVQRESTRKFWIKHNLGGIEEVDVIRHQGIDFFKKSRVWLNGNFIRIPKGEISYPNLAVFL